MRLRPSVVTRSTHPRVQGPVDLTVPTSIVLLIDLGCTTHEYNRHPDTTRLTRSELRVSTIHVYLRSTPPSTHPSGLESGVLLTSTRHHHLTRFVRKTEVSDTRPYPLQPVVTRSTRVEVRRTTTHTHSRTIRPHPTRGPVVVLRVQHPSSPIRRRDDDLSHHDGRHRRRIGPPTPYTCGERGFEIILSMDSGRHHRPKNERERNTKVESASL